MKFGIGFGRARNWVNVLRCSITVRVCASRVCCLNIVVKLGNSSIFKWMSRLVNNPWMLCRLGLKKNQPAFQRRAHWNAVRARGNDNWMLHYSPCHSPGELIDHAISGNRLPEIMKEIYLSFDTWARSQLYSSRNASALIVWHKGLFSSLRKKFLCRSYRKLTWYISSALVIWMEIVNEKSLEQYRCWLFRGSQADFFRCAISNLYLSSYFFESGPSL